MTAGMLSAYKTLGFVIRLVANPNQERWTQLYCKNLIPLPRYTLCYAFTKYKTPMIQFHNEGLFQKHRIQKIAAIIILTVKGMFQNGERYSSISMRGKTRLLDVSEASRMIATSLKTFIKESTKQKQKKPSLAHHHTNVTLMEDIVNFVVFKSS